MLFLLKSTGGKRVKIVADRVRSPWLDREALVQPSDVTVSFFAFVFFFKRGDQRVAAYSRAGKTRHCTDEKNFLVSATINSTQLLYCALFTVFT